MAAGRRQLRLLLWKDYLIRKRKLVTLAGVIWATGIMFSLYFVRINIDNQDFPTCQFPARALPSAGVLPFLQSFICTVNNECSPLDQYEELPSYEKSTLTQIQHKMAPFLNDSVLDLVSTMPDALQLLATLSDIVDEPTLVDVSKHGLNFKDLFINPSRVRRYVSSQLDLDDDVAQSLMTSKLSFQGVLKGNLNRCSAESLSQTLIVKNSDHFNIIVKQLCSIPDSDLQKMFMDLLPQVNFSKYIEMIGEMYYKLSGDDRLTKLGDMLTAMLRMTNLNNFLPPELVNLFKDTESDFSYIHLSLISKLMDLFEPTFGSTQEYKSIKDFADTAVLGIQYLNKIFGKESDQDSEEDEIVLTANDGNRSDIFENFNQIFDIFNKTGDIIDEVGDTSVDPFNVLYQVTNFIFKFLPAKYKHDFLFYSTLMSNLMESGEKEIAINIHIEKITYDVVLKNSEAIKILVGLPPTILAKGFEALVDAERIQILTSTISDPGQIFCNASMLQSFFLVSAPEAESLNSQFCTEAWKTFTTDLISSFGVFEVRDNINSMASLFIKETLGVDTSDQLNSLDQVFNTFTNFCKAMIQIEKEEKHVLDWKKLLNITEDSEIMKTMKEKTQLAKQILISIHLALAKEVIKQNPILDYKMTPILIDFTTVLTALNDQLDLTPPDLAYNLKIMYASIVHTLLMTSLDEHKTYKSLSTNSEDIMCNGVDHAAMYLEFPSDVDSESLVSVLCNASIVLENRLSSDSAFAKAIVKLKKTAPNVMDDVDWTKVINNIQKLFSTIDKDYPYLFGFSTYGMDEDTQTKLKAMLLESKEFWFNIRNFQRGLHLSLKFAFKLLDLLDYGIFDITDGTWLQIKYIISISNGPFSVLDDFIKLTAGLITNSNHTSDIPPITENALSRIIHNLPQMIIDTVNIMVSDVTEVDPIITLMNADPAWPCSNTSIAELLNLTTSSKDAVRAMETLLCMKKDLQEEWVEYLTVKKGRVSKLKNWNDTEYEPHVYLRFSATFDSLINNTSAVKNILLYIFNDNPTDGRYSLISALKYAFEAMNTTDRNDILRKVFTKIDIVLNAIHTSTVNKSVPLNSLWENLIKCIDGTYIDADCREVGRATWKYSLKTLSVIFDTIATDLMTYFTEVNEPDSNLIQLLGFTKNTGLYILYDKFPEFVGVLLNSYWDFGFMSQIRRASLTHFWDCDAVVSALVPAPGSSIDLPTIQRVRPFVCPSILYWISLPRGDNVLLDVIANPQYIFYSLPVQNVTSIYASAFKKVTNLADFITDIAKRNQTSLAEELKIDNLKEKLTKSVDKILTYNIKDTDPSYRLFNEINRKQIVSNMYLIRIVAIVNQLAEAFENLEIEIVDIDKEDNIDKLKDNFSKLKTIFKRKSVDAIAIHYDLLTDVFWSDDDNYTLTDAIDSMCNDIVMNDTSKTILADDMRGKTQLCAKNYNSLYKAVEGSIIDNYEDSKRSLLELVRVLQSGNVDNITNIFQFLNDRKQLVNSLKSSIKYSYDLGLPIYLKYLQANLQSYDVIISFLSGDDWWRDLKELYSGPYAQKFFSYLENSFEVANDLFTNFDRIHLVRLLRDINMNETDSFCQSNITLSDYIPDSTGMLSELKQEICNEEKIELYKEITPLLFASQGYESSLKLSKVINYTALNIELSKTESKLGTIEDGPRNPQRPPWVNDLKLAQLKEEVIQLLSKEKLIKILFTVLSNGVDAGTLFLNQDQCILCSQLTTWFKQLNLQVFKKQDYDNLLCHMQTMTMNDIYHTLKNDFHWDMAISELISTRNYTKYELNKSMNEFLDLVKVHLQEDLASHSTKLTECLARNITKNEFGNATLFVTILTHAVKLIRTELPHLREIDGIKDLMYLKDLSNQVSPYLDVTKPLTDYLINKNDFSAELMKEIADRQAIHDIEESEINLRLAINASESMEYLNLHKMKWQEICEREKCSSISELINNHLNKTLIETNLPMLQTEEFWKFKFVSHILRHVEGLLEHTARLLGVASNVDVKGVLEGQLDAMLDLLVTILMDETTNSVLYSLGGIIDELHPLLKDTLLENDLKGLSDGLKIIHQFKTYLMDADLKVEVSKLFLNPEAVESGLKVLGINNTNFWSLAAPRIHVGYIQLKPALSSKELNYHIANFVCQMDHMSQVIMPANLDVVTADDVYGAVVEQFCGIGDQRAKEVMLVLLKNINFNLILDKMKDMLLSMLYSASYLTQQEGDNVMDKFPQMAALLPAMQENMGDMVTTMADEPLFQSLKDFSSVGNLLSTPDFLANAGNMLCGKPFKFDMSRVLQNIINSKDLSHDTNQAQLDVLPTDFCRSLYTDIISINGGKIVWSFIKPLIMGKILYTPPNPTVDRIIQKANTTFSNMIRMTNLVHSFAGSFWSVDMLSDHREGLEVMQRILNAPEFEELKKILIGDNVPEIKVNVDGLFNQFGDLKGMGSLLTKASNLLQCFNLDRFRATPDEYQLTHEAVKLTRINEFTAGIVFMNSEQANDLTNVEYKIRMDIENVPTTKRLTNFLWTPGPEASFVEDMRYFRGFIQVQDLVDKAIVQLSQNKTIRNGGTGTGTEDELKWGMYTQQMPYPCYRKDFFQTSLYESQAMSVTFFFGFVFTIASVVRFIVCDKETGNTMLMSVMGVNLNYHTLSWFIVSCLELLVTITCVTFVLHFGMVLPNTDPSLVFTLFLIFTISLLSFCYMMSKLFTLASVAAVCAVIGYFISFMPFVIIMCLEDVLTSSLKSVICLSMSTALCYAFMYITRFEAMGVGGQWANVWSSPIEGEHMSVGMAAALMLFDAAIYFIIGWLVDRYYGIKTLKSSIINCTTTHEKAGVSIVNVTKIYGEGSRRAKLALENVSMELHKGQITTLLGHNGAGKTTLINILTGMLKPTKGHVVIRSEHEGGTQLGVCPQKDVLFEYMTAREHITLYAQLKSGLRKDEVQDEVEGMLRVLNLGAVCEEPVVRLSGGTRRRLCVALAFIARPQLVSLDEPTAGVDPSARRDIWSMIMRLKEDRTILLTTHHLDEAELLSDQIVIMHKGQIHTTGLPIEIKRTLGNGYKLTVLFPDKNETDEMWPEEDRGVEEKSKQLLAVVRDVIKNANMTEVNGLEVEVTMPFYDNDGSNNDFLQLCAVLESSQDSLGFSKYSMDCSSLEQVFFDICQQADAPQQNIGYVSEESPSKSVSSSSSRAEHAPLVAGAGPLRGSAARQLLALMHTRYIHHIRNRWLLFLLVVLPSVFVVLAMAVSMLRPPADTEVSTRLSENLYGWSTQFLVPRPSIHSDTVDPAFAERIMEMLQIEKQTKNWTSKDTPQCKCLATRQDCEIDANATKALPELMRLPDVNTLNDWIVHSEDIYLENRYGGFTSALKNNLTNLIAWYNNKGHHAMPSYLNALNNAILRAAAGEDHNITTYTHPLKISKEQMSKSTVYQHVADAGISALILVAYALISAGSAIYLVGARRSQEKRLQLLCGVTPALYWATALAWDLIIILINVIITAAVMMAFGFPVFVARNNLPAICILLMLYGYACSCLMHVLEKLFTESSLANMILFCGNMFFGLSGVTILLILDIISESDATDNARWILHKIYMLAPQFDLTDGLLEIAKNTIQAEVLSRYGMDTYRDPFKTDLVLYHYLYLIVVGTALMLFNLAIEYDCFEVLLVRFRSERMSEEHSSELEPSEVSAERQRVRTTRAHAHAPLIRVNTIGNINRGFVHTEDKRSMQPVTHAARDVAQCVELGKTYPTRAGRRRALDELTLGIPPGECTALLGENGAGKSTTFAMLTGELRPSTGNVYLADRRCAPGDLGQGLISYCPQSDAIDPLLTVRETLVFYCRLRGITEKEEVIKRTLNMFELSKYSEVRCGTLSGGNKRKLCTAIAFMGRTPLVLLDEPTSGMDPMSRACVYRGVRAACGAGARGVLVSTHALHDARRLAARVALLRAGRLVALASLDDCLRRFGGGYVVQCRVCRGEARDAWRRVRALAPHAALRVLHRHTLHFLVPTHFTVDKKEITTRLSDIFRLMSQLQATCDIEDYTVNQSSLEQMFLSFTDKAEMELDSVDIEPLPSPESIRKHENELDSITSL